MWMQLSASTLLWLPGRPVWTLLTGSLTLIRKASRVGGGWGEYTRLRIRARAWVCVNRKLNSGFYFSVACTWSQRHLITSDLIWSDLISSDLKETGFISIRFLPLHSKSMSTETASLVLEDGTAFKGRLFGANVAVSGEVGKSLVESSNMSWRSC